MSKRLVFVDVFESNYCRAVFAVSLILIYFLVPKKIFFGYFNILGAVFIVLAAAVVTCFVRNIKERIVFARASGVSLAGIISIVFGIGALQACTIGAPVCGSFVGMGFLALVFPSVALDFFIDYGIYVVFVSMIFQVVALYFMGCLRLR